MTDSETDYQACRIDRLKAECERLRAALLYLRDRYLEDACFDIADAVAGIDAALAGAPAEPASEKSRSARLAEELAADSKLLADALAGSQAECERLHRALAAAYATSELFAAECLRWRRAHADGQPAVDDAASPPPAAEDRSEPPPNYDIYYWHGPVPSLAGCDQSMTREQAVAACWAHRDAVLAGAHAKHASEKGER